MEVVNSMSIIIKSSTKKEFQHSYIVPDLLLRLKSLGIDMEQLDAALDMVDDEKTAEFCRLVEKITRLET